MNDSSPGLCIAFDGPREIARGPLRDVALAVKQWCETPDAGSPLVFDEETSVPIEFDLRGTPEDVVARIESLYPGTPRPSDHSEAVPVRRGPGRPKLGVVSREITLLPRHWEWLGEQPGGASVTLRKLVDHARRDNAGKDRLRRSQESAYRFMSTMAGNEPGFEEATRAMYRGEPDRFASITQDWPEDVREHSRRLARSAFVAPDADRLD